MSITYRHKQVPAVTTGIMYSLLSSLGFVWVIRSQLKPSVTDFMVHPTWPPFFLSFSLPCGGFFSETAKSKILALGVVQWALSMDM